MAFIKRFLILCGAAGVFALAFAGGIYLFESSLAPSSVVESSRPATQQASSAPIEPRPNPVRKLEPGPPPTMDAPPRQNVRIIGLDKDAAPPSATRRPASPDPGLAPGLPTTPDMIDYALRLGVPPDEAGGAGGPGDVTGEILPDELVDGVDSILSEGGGDGDLDIGPDEESDQPDNAPIQLIARPIEPEPVTGIGGGDDVDQIAAPPRLPASRPANAPRG